MRSRFTAAPGASPGPQATARPAEPCLERALQKGHMGASACPKGTPDSLFVTVLPIRVPEGPIDPYEPFPFDGPAAPSWSRAPIVKGRDAAGIDGRDAVMPSAATTDEARFVDIDVIASTPPPIDSWRFADDILGTENAPEMQVHGTLDDAGGDSYGGWLLVDVAGPEAPEYAPRDMPVVDPWAIVSAPASGDGLNADTQPPTPAPADASSPAPPSFGESRQEHDVVRRNGGPPMSSRAVLMVGTLALLCLALAAALAFQAIGEPDETPPALEEASTEALAGAPVQRARETRRPNPLLESLPVSDTTLTSIERAAMGPLELELERLGRALQGAFGRSSSEVAPVLRPYIAHAAERMRTHPARFRLVVNAPRADLAASRADAILVAFEGAGLPADMLTLTAGAGAPGVTFDR